MALFRQIHTCFWEDDKVLDEMELEEKFFYLYLLTNQRVKQCGCYDISWKKFVLETTLTKQQIEKMLEKFENEYNLIKYNKQTKEILLLNFYKYNWTASPKVKRCIESELEDIKDPTFVEYIKKMIGYRYPIDTLSIDYGEEDKNKNKNKNKNKKKNKSDSELSQNGNFVAPTLTEIIAFSQELGFNDEEYCEKFYNTYESVGWVNANKVEIKNWKLVFKNWIKKDNLIKNEKQEYDTRKFYEDESGLFKYDSEGVKHYV